MRRYVLTITCPDRIGIVAAVTGFIAGHGGSVLEAAQHGDLSSERFFLRIEVTAASLPFGPDEFRQAFEPVAQEFAMEWHLTDTHDHKRVVLMVSQEEHCLADLLYRWRSGDLECDIPCVISNHDDLRSFVEWHGIPFRLVPVPKEPAGKAAGKFTIFRRSSSESRVAVMNSLGAWAAFSNQWSANVNQVASQSRRSGWAGLTKSAER